MFMRCCGDDAYLSDLTRFYVLCDRCLWRYSANTPPCTAMVSERAPTSDMSGCVASRATPAFGAELSLVVRRLLVVDTSEHFLSFFVTFDCALHSRGGVAVCNHSTVHRDVVGTAFQRWTCQVLLRKLEGSFGFVAESALSFFRAALSGLS